ncbi:MAG TPA: MarR family transcriptional regulator [Dermatophilaceae bacterium]
MKQVKPARGPATALPPVVQDALSGVSDALSVEAVLASRALLAVVARSMAAALEEVTLPQFRILVLLSAHGPLRTGTLAEQAGVHPSTLSRTSDRLVKGRWVRRIANPDSRREVLLELTSKGARLVADVTTRRAQELDAILVRVPTRQRRRVFEGFAAFSSAAGEDTGGDLLLLGLPPLAQASRNTP